MGTGYVRQSSADITPGSDITAGPLNNEFNAIKDAFDGLSGHSHDGTSGEGPPIDLAVGVTGVLPIFNGGTGGSSISEAQVALEVEPKVVPSTVATYWRGDKTFQDFATSVRGSLLTGFTVLSTGAVLASDTVLQALGKLQGQVSAKADDTATTTSLATKAPLASPTLTGTPSGPTAAIGTNTTQLSTTAFVIAEIASRISAAIASVTQIISATAGSLLVNAANLTSAHDFITFTPSAIDLNTFINGKATLTSNTTFAAPTNAKAGRSGTLRLQQDATGSRTGTWNTFWNFGPSGPPVLSTTAGAVDYVFYQIDDGATRAICSFRSGT